MIPLEFVREEYENVDRALQETLRYDYGPEESAEFFVECCNRLARIKAQIAPGAIDENNRQAIAALLGDLGHIATQISLIERSRLGEFSWPFVPHHLAGLADITELLGKLEQSNLRADDLLFGRHGVLHCAEAGRFATPTAPRPASACDSPWGTRTPMSD